jgi:hypothetical protein
MALPNRRITWDEDKKTEEDEGFIMTGMDILHTTPSRYGAQSKDDYHLLKT